MVDQAVGGNFVRRPSEGLNEAENDPPMQKRSSLQRGKVSLESSAPSFFLAEILPTRRIAPLAWYLEMLHHMSVDGKERSVAVLHIAIALLLDK